MIYQSVSMHSVFARVIRNTRIQDTSYLFDMREWIPEAMGYMQTKQVLETRWKDIKIYFHKGKLPCDLHHIKAVEYNGCRLREGNDSRALETLNRKPQQGDYIPVSMMKLQPIPGTPATPFIPGSPSVPGVPGIPGVPEVPAIPAVHGPLEQQSRTTLASIVQPVTVGMNVNIRITDADMSSNPIVLADYAITAADIADQPATLMQHIADAINNGPYGNITDPVNGYGATIGFGSFMTIYHGPVDDPAIAAPNPEATNGKFAIMNFGSSGIGNSFSGGVNDPTSQLAIPAVPAIPGIPAIPAIPAVDDIPAMPASVGFDPNTGLTDQTLWVSAFSSDFIAAVARGYHPAAWYQASMGYISTSFADGDIRVHYAAMQVDKDGLPLIPDNEDYKQALYYYIRAMMIGAGYKDNIFQEQVLMQRFELHAARAIGQITYPSVDSMENKVTQQVRFIPQEGYFENFFSTDGGEKYYY